MLKQCRTKWRIRRASIFSVLYRSLVIICAKSVISKTKVQQRYKENGEEKPPTKVSWPNSVDQKNNELRINNYHAEITQPTTQKIPKLNIEPIFFTLNDLQYKITNPVKHYAKLKTKLSNDIEENPGPGPNPNSIELINNKNQIIITYNVQGCKDYKKLKRITNFFNKQCFKNNCIINLQETHLENKLTLPYHWKNGNVQSVAKGNSGGVAILYNTGYFDKIINSKSDNEGRICSLTASKNNKTYLYVNAYAPNDHYKAIEFFHRIENWIQEEIASYPSINIIISGDFNFIFDPNVDSVGRQYKKQEAKVAEMVKRIMTRLNLKDSYREKHKWGGFTWGRNSPMYIRSRLDHILIDANLTNDVIQCMTTRTPYESDHSLLYVEINMDELKFGPGIKRCNADLLNDEIILKRVKENLKEIEREIPNHWNAHQQLDYMKMHTRNIMLVIGKEKAKQRKSALEHNEHELNLLNEKLDKLLIEREEDKSTRQKQSTERSIERLREAIELVEEENETLKKELTKKLIFRARAKWAEEGEKSNKYFLNLIKERQSKMIIRKIVSNGITYSSQTEISKAITKFY